MNETTIVHNGDGPFLTDDQFLDMLAKDVDILDTTPADALKGTVREMAALETRRYATLPMGVVGTAFDESLAGPEDYFFHGLE